MVLLSVSAIYTCLFRWIENALYLCLQLHEKSLDTKALLAWSDDTVVLSFRGTASLKNVFAGMPLFAKLTSKLIMLCSARDVSPIPAFCCSTEP